VCIQSTLIQIDTDISNKETITELPKKLNRGKQTADFYCEKVLYVLHPNKNGRTQGNK